MRLPNRICICLLAITVLAGVSVAQAQTRASNDSEQGQLKVTPRSRSSTQEPLEDSPAINRGVSVAPKVTLKKFTLPEARQAELAERFARPTPRGRASIDAPDLQPVPRGSARTTR